MALVSRPTKTAGNTTYVAEVAAGATTIKASEVDADFNAIITGGVNNIETANINAAGLAAAALAANAVTTVKIADLNVTTGKLAVGASVNALQTAAVTTGLSFDTVETTVLTLPAITTRGGRVIIIGSGAFAAENGAGTQATITIRIKRGGVTQHTITYTLIGGSASHKVPIPPPFFTEAPAAGTYTYTITMQTNDANLDISTPGSNAGSYWAVELG